MNHEGGRPKKNSSLEEPFSLTDIGVTKKQSHRAQRLAAIPEGLDESQRAMIAAKIANLPSGVNAGTAVSIDTPSRKQAAALLNVGEGSVGRAREVINYGDDELIAEVD